MSVSRTASQVAEKIFSCTAAGIDKRTPYAEFRAFGPCFHAGSRFFDDRNIAAMAQLLSSATVR